MDLFVGTWMISDWSPDTDVVVPGGIPANGFMIGGPLHIMRELTLTSDFYRLEWLTQSSQPCFASGLQFTGQDPLTLSSANGPGILVSFAGRELFCDLTLSMDPNDNLTGTINLTGQVGTPQGPEVGSGTFTATANSGGSNAASIRRPT